MADDKKTKLSITIAAVDRVTAVVRAISARIGSLAAPAKAGIKGLGGAFRSLGGIVSKVGSVIGDVLGKIPLIGGVIAGVVGGATAALVHLVGQFDDLGDKAERLGVGVDFLASTEYAAEKAGTTVEVLDNGLKSLSENMGQLRAGTGRLKSFLDKVSPALERQLKAAKSNEEAFDLLANAMAKLQDPAKRAALAQKALSDSALAPLLAKGAKGLQEMRQRYLELAGPQQEAADQAGQVDDAMHDLHASLDGVKAAIVVGLAPAMKIVVKRMSDWFVAHRADVTEFAKKLGDELPGAMQKVVTTVGQALEKLGKFFGVLGDIYDKIKEIYEYGDTKKQAKKLATQVPQAQRAALASQARTNATLISGGRRGLLSGIGSLVGVPLANTDIGRSATEKVLNLAGVGPGLLRNDFITGKFHQEFAKQLDAANGFSSHAAVNVPITGKVLDIFKLPTAQENSSKITVDFTNAPRGTRVSADPKSTADVDLNVGYQLVTP